jgi:hypothetical protein
MTTTIHTSSEELISYEVSEEDALSAEQRIQALEASLANRQLTTLLQGGVIGLVLGGTTVWFVANNARRSLAEGEPQETGESSPDESDEEESDA